MYKKMLVPLDGSDFSEVLFPYVKELAGRLGLEMTFLYVCNSPESESLPMYRAYVEHTAEIIESRARKVLEKTGKQAQGEALKAEGVVVAGNPAEEILRYIYENEVDILLMATHGRSGISRWALGSVADKVLRSATVPVLLVRGATDKTPDNGEIRRILVTLDGSELAESVLPHVESLVKQWDAEDVDVILFMVCEPLVIPSTYASDMEVPVNMGELIEEHITYSKKVAEKYLAGVAMRLKEAGLKVYTEVKEGVPENEIIEYADEYSCNLIAMATNGRSGIGRWAYGSVSEKVIYGASSPVLLVRPPSADGLPFLQTFVGTVRSLPPW